MGRIVKKPEIRKAELVRTARAIFETRGYDKTTMQDVMDNLGIAKGTIYHYFKSKDELLVAVIESIVDEGVEQMERMIDQSSGNALEKIRMLVAAGNKVERNREMMEQMYRPGSLGMYTRIVIGTLYKQARLFARLVEQGCAEGTFKTDTPLETTEFLLTAIQFLMDKTFYPWEEKELLRRAKIFPGLVEALLEAQPGTFRFLFPQISAAWMDNRNTRAVDLEQESSRKRNDPSS